MILKEVASYKPLYVRLAGPRAADTRVFPFIGGQREPGEDVKDTWTEADPLPVLLLVHVCMHVCLSAAQYVSAYTMSMGLVYAV